MDSRAEWFRQRTQACREGANSCPPLTWSISPHLSYIAPDVLKWYYEMSYETGKDYFMLPPSGHLYAYPSSMEEMTIQDKYVAATEKDAHLLGTNSTVHWEWFNKWRYAEDKFLPKYAKKQGTIKGIFPVNVPYMFPTFTWDRGQFFKVLVGKDGGKVVLFRPREWRGIDDGRGEFMDKKFYLSPKNMAKELGEYPQGTVTAVYMTSDGGLTLNNSILELVKILPEHVRLVSADRAIQLALEASEKIEDK
jgi:putative glycoside hydrolase with GxGYxYP motif